MIEQSKHTRSGKFVTRIAWLFIVLSILLTTLTIAQYVVHLHMLATLKSVQGGALAGKLPTAPHLAAFARMAIGLASLGISLGLLKRWRWARRAFLALATIGVASNAYHLVVALSSISSVSLPDDAAPGEVWIIRISGLLSYAVPAALCLFLGWLIIRFMSRSVRHEFSSPAQGD